MSSFDPSVVTTAASASMDAVSSDAALLSAYQRGDASAMTSLMRRHLDRVYAVAFRQTRDAHLAEDVAQAVFLTLARKAGSLPEGTVVAAWLHTAACLSARHALRTDARRRRHERIASEYLSDRASSLTASAADQVAERDAATALLAQLDLALESLKGADREAVVLRYLDRQPLAAVADRLGTSQAAAAKRVARAVEKLRDRLHRQGVPREAQAIGDLLSAAPTAAAPALAARINASLSTVAAPGSAVVSTPTAVTIIAGATAVVAWLLWWLFGHSATLPSAIPVRIAAPIGKIAPPAPNQLSYQAIRVHDLAMAGFPYPPGWPLALPGEIISSPVVADLLGDGNLEVVVASYARDNSIHHVHPDPNRLPLLFAFRADGSVLPGWPVTLGGRGGRDVSWGGWASSPTVFRRGGKDHIAILGPSGRLFIVSGDRSVLPLGHSDCTVTVPVFDLAGNGTPDVIAGGLLSTVDGDDVAGWPNNRRFGNGYAPCIGDAAGDGKVELFHLFYTNPDGQYANVVAFNNTGRRLHGWPQLIQDASWLPPVMGDIDGSGTMSVIGTYGTFVNAWHYDGTPLAADFKVGKMKGVFKANVWQMSSCASLADLTGSGHADIVCFDQQTNTLRAWHADGKAVWAPPRGQPRDVDGIVAAIPEQAAGVSVASLGDDPHVMDFFAGSYWIRHFPDGHVTVTNMLPDDAQFEWAQPTITDLEHTGQADILFGASDGRVAIYRTGLKYDPKRIEWPTANGNFQHTGAWIPPSKRK